MKEYKVSLTWVLAIVALTVLVAFSLAAVTPFGEQMNALAVTIAGDVVCNQCVGINGDGTNDIKDGSVTNAKLATNAVSSGKIATSAVTTAKINGGAVTNAKLADGAVTTSKIADGTIKYSDVSKAFIAVEHRNDCNCGGTGWDPDGTKSGAVVYDDRVNPSSAVYVTVVGYSGFNVISCGTATQAGFYGYFVVNCDRNIPSAAGLNYAILNNPAYG
ncbi:MAG TPA: hypothetical protein VGJ42_01905 [Nitrososphaera sp.]